MLEDALGKIIYDVRKSKGLTQDQFGAMLSVTGPAIFKFEKAQVRPSLELWLKIAAEAELPERRAVLLWLQAKVPKKFRHYIESGKSASSARLALEKAGQTDYSTFEDRDAIRAAAAQDKKLPRPLKELLDDDELWELFRPTGHEINMLRDIFAPLGKGSKTKFGEALRLIREFTHSF